MRYEPFEWVNDQPKRTLCEFCKNAVPNDTYGCEWSDLGEPVPKWEAIETVFKDELKGVDTRIVKSFCVLKCPKFLFDSSGIATKAELNALIEEDGDEPVERYRINKMDSKTMLCKFNDGIDCANKRKCRECNWNPTIAEERKKELKQNE